MIEFAASSIKKLRAEDFAALVSEKLAAKLHFFENSKKLKKRKKKLLKQSESYSNIVVFLVI